MDGLVQNSSDEDELELDELRANLLEEIAFSIEVYGRYSFNRITPF